MNKEQFLADVRHEVKMLKKNALPEELSRLDFWTLNPSDVKLCIYGQITGDCTSQRAKDLMNLCCIRVLDVYSGVDKIQNRDIEEIISKGYVNGKYEGQPWDEDYRTFSYLSALEGYIASRGAKNKEIIDYLKGEYRNLIL